MKKILSAIVCGAFIASGVVGFAACGESQPELTVWGPSAQQVSLQKMIEQFKAENPDITYDIAVGVCGEGDGYSMMSNDPQSGADVFAFANDQLVNLYSIGALSPLSPSTVTALKQSDNATAVESGKLGDNYYGYPYAADNGFFLYYNKDIISDEDAKDIDKILDACEKAGKDFIFEGGNSWYALSLAYGAGGKYEVTYEGTKVVKVETNLDQKAPDSDYSYGVLGGYELGYILQKGAFVKTGDDTIIDNSLTAGTFGACIRGTWKGDAIKTALGDDYGATVLPQWTSELDGNTYDWYSFAGCKLYGVNAYSKHPEDAHKLAAFLSGAKMQEKRFDDNGIGPSNLTVAAMPKVQQNLAVATMMKQIAEASVIQTSMPQSYWDEVGAFGEAMKSLDTTADPAILQERIVQLVEALKAEVKTETTE